MAKLTKAKATEMLRDGTAHGKKLTPKHKRYFGMISHMQKGGIIEDNMGQWAHPGEITKINSNNITMKGVGYPVLGISDVGDVKKMMPNKDYKFKGKSVVEIPQKLDDLTNFTNYNMEKGKSGIHIKASHKGLLHKHLGIPQGKTIPSSKSAIS